MGVRASYLIHGADEERDEVDYNPESLADCGSCR
jgi:hypothetical protein